MMSSHHVFTCIVVEVIVFPGIVWGFVAVYPNISGAGIVTFIVLWTLVYRTVLYLNAVSYILTGILCTGLVDLAFRDFRSSR